MIAIITSSALFATSYHFPYDYLLLTINEIELKSVSSIVIVKIAAIGEEWFPHDCNERFVCIGACIAGNKSRGVTGDVVESKVKIFAYNFLRKMC